MPGKPKSPPQNAVVPRGAIAHPASMIRVAALKDVGIYSDDYPCAEDYELFFRIAERYDTDNIPEVLVIKEHTPESLSVARRRTSLVNRLRIQLKYFSFSNLHAYLGVLQSLIFLTVPYGVVIALKRQLKAVN